MQTEAQARYPINQCTARVDSCAAWLAPTPAHGYSTPPPEDEGSEDIEVAHGECHRSSFKDGIVQASFGIEG